MCLGRMSVDPHLLCRGGFESTALNLVGRSVYVADGAPRIFRKKRIFGQDLGQA